MLSSALILLMNSVFCMLRIAPGDSFPRPLSSREEEECLRRFAAGDMEARNTLIEHNLRLVVHIIKKYYTQSEDAEDLVSIGTIGLIKAINSYREDKGVRLATYASRCIENEVLMHFRAAKKSAGDVSLSDALDPEGEGGGLSVMDLIADGEDMTERISAKEQCRQLRRCVEQVLTPREKRIITLRYGLEGKAPLTQRETAAICSISRSYVSRIEKRALEKLRRALA